jgi:hypothetical protein
VARWWCCSGGLTAQPSHSSLRPTAAAPAAAVAQLIANAGGVRSLVCVMAQHATSDSIQCNGCLALMSLVRGEGEVCQSNQWHVAKAGAIQVIAAAMARFRCVCVCVWVCVRGQAWASCVEPVPCAGLPAVYYVHAALHPHNANPSLLLCTCCVVLCAQEQLHGAAERAALPHPPHT